MGLMGLLILLSIVVPLVGTGNSAVAIPVAFVAVAVLLSAQVARRRAHQDWQYIVSMLHDIAGFEVRKECTHPGYNYFRLCP